MKVTSDPWYIKDVATTEAVKNYCKKFGFTYVETPDGPLADREEWGGVFAAGFDGDPSYCATMIVLQVDGRCFVMSEFADGVRHMSDVLTEVYFDQLLNAVDNDVPLHAADNGN